MFCGNFDEKSFGANYKVAGSPWECMKGCQTGGRELRGNRELFRRIPCQNTDCICKGIYSALASFRILDFKDLPGIPCCNVLTRSALATDRKSQLRSLRTAMDIFRSPSEQSTFQPEAMN